MHGYILVRVCSTYIYVDGVKHVVDKLRDIRVLTKDIHQIICVDGALLYLT